MKVAFLTLGCKVNAYETEKMKREFEKAGHRIVSFEENAEVYIINTCTVTNIADRKSRKMIHRAKRNHPEALVAATGCYVDSSEKRGEYDTDIDIFVPNKDKKEILKIILEALGKQEEGTEGEEEASLHGREPDIRGFSSKAREEEHTRAYLNVQQGCNQYCTYCIIPYVRGPLSSRPEEEVVQEVKRLAKEGIIEVVVTGIHLSSYGVDFTKKKSFLELEGKPLLHLIKKIAEVPGIERVRLGSLEPRIITEHFVKELTTVRELCPHFHLSLQSGCDETLRRMNRHYTTAEYLEKVRMLRHYFKDPAITTDIITGFPGETEEEFLTTLDFAKDVQFAKIHMFKYSRRKGTMADSMEGQNTEQTKAERLKRLSVVEQESESKYRKNFFGKKERVLFEEIVFFDREEYLVGYNERYLKLGVKITDRQEAKKQINTIGEVLVSDREIGEFLLCEKKSCFF